MELPQLPLAQSCTHHSLPALDNLHAGVPTGTAATTRMLCAAYPKDERSTDSCVRLIAEAQRKDGFRRTNDTSLAELERCLRENGIQQERTIWADDLLGEIIYKTPSRRRIDFSRS